MTSTQHLRNIVYLLSLILISGIFLYIGKSIFIPFFIALFLAFFINKLRMSFQKTPIIGKYIPDLVGFIAASFALLGVIIIFYQIISANINNAQTLIPLYIEQTKIIHNNILASLKDFPLFEKIISASLDKYANPEAITSAFNYFIKSLTRWIRAFTTMFFSVLIYTIFILLERKILLHKILKCIIDDNSKKKISKTLKNIDEMIEKYIIVKGITSVLIALLCFIVLFFAKVDFPLLWTFLTFIFNFIPIIGSVIAVFFPVFIALVQPDGGISLALIVLLGLIVMHQIIGAGVEPRMYGETLNISPLVVLLSLTMGQALWGIIGMLLCIPLTVSLIIILSQFSPTRPIAILLSSNGLINNTTNTNISCKHT